MNGLTVVLCISAAAAFGQQCEPGCVPQSNSAVISSDGTAHITRVIPVPNTVSPEAQKMLARQPGPVAKSLAENRTRTDEFRTRRSAEARKLFPVHVEEKTIGGVRTDVITPPNIGIQTQPRVDQRARRRIHH
jgi:epsilon-lactone hydrolase